MKKIYTFEEWNNEVVPRIGKDLKDVSNKLPNGFLTIYQQMECLVEEEGKEFKCIAWSPPNDEPYVKCVLHNSKDEVIKKVI